jgi:hypothetical protein
MKNIKGLYLTLPQAIEMTPPTQGALFDFKVRKLRDLEPLAVNSKKH